MECREDVEQQIWEFVYGLLSQDEADELNRHITTDPDAARLYAEVKLQADILAEAAQLHEPPVSLVKPSDAVTGLPTQTPDDIVVRPRPSSMAALAANWFVGLAAALLACLMGYSYLKPDSSIRKVAVRIQQQNLIERNVTTTLYGPETLQTTPANIIIVRTQSASGEPRSVPLTYRFYDKKERLLVAREAQTDMSGLVQIETPEGIDCRNVHLEVATNSGVPLPTVEKALPVDEVELTTHLTLDKPLYRPGETIRYRSLTLSRFDLRVRREVTVEFRVLDSDDTVVPQSQNDDVTEHGVGQGEFTIAGSQPGGKYTLFARSPSDEFPETRRDFYIRQYHTPTLKKRLEFVRDSFGPGDEVVADFSVERAEGGVVPNAPLRILAQVDDHAMLNLHTAADEQGAYTVRFALPREMQNGDGRLSVTVNNGTQETITRPIPVSHGGVSVDFFPESGELVAGVENRVYFHARDSMDKPVHVEGRVLDSSAREMAAVETVHEGRGRFSLTPLRDESYHLEIDTPAGAADGQLLPEVSERQFVTLNAGAGVFGARQPIRLEIHSTQYCRPLAVTAVCRGAVAGQQVVSGDHFVLLETGIGSCNITVPLAQHADGVIRLTAYDLSARPPQPVAERLVYRRPTHKLDIRLAGEDKAYASGAQVDLGLSVQDENGQPRQAVLGVSVVDDALLALADDKSPHMTTHFWLTSQIDRPEELEDANLYLKEDSEAAVALDLALGTLGWRQFARVPLDRLAQADVSDTGGGKRASKSTTVSRGVGERAKPVVLADNNRESRKALESSVREYHADRLFDVQRTGQVVFSGGVAVLIALVTMGLLRLTAGVKVWAPAVVAAMVSVIVGWHWMDARIDVRAELAALPRASGDEQVEVARVETRKPDVSVEKAGEVVEEVAEAQVTESVEKAVEAEFYKRSVVEKDGEAAGQDLPKAVAAAGGRPAPASAAARAPMADRPVASPTYEEKDDRGEGMGGGFGGMAKDKLAKPGGELARREDARESRLARHRSLAASAPAERETRGKLGDLKKSLDVVAPVLAEEGIVQPEKNYDDRLGTARDAELPRATSAGGMGAGGAVRDESDSMPEDDRLLVRKYAYFPGKQMARGLQPAYAETLLWQPLLLTDANGRTSVEFTLPGVVTSYRVLVDGHVDGRIGSGEGKVISPIRSE